MSIVCAEAMCCDRKFHSIIVLGKKLYLNVFVLQQYGFKQYFVHTVDMED